MGECGASHAQYWGSQIVLVTEGDAVRARVGVDGGGSIAGLFDLDGDGRLEVLLTSSFTNQGNTVEHASLVRVDASTLGTIKDFGEVMNANCASSFGDQTSTVSIVRAVTRVGSQPEFKIEKKTEPCH